MIIVTNVANIVFPGHYNPKIDKWCDYKEQLQCALVAAGVSVNLILKDVLCFYHSAEKILVDCIIVNTRETELRGI